MTEQESFPFDRSYVYWKKRAEGKSGELLFGSDTRDDSLIVIKRPAVGNPNERAKQQKDVKAELDALITLRDHNVAQVPTLRDYKHDFVDANFHHTYFVTDLAPGKSLKDWIEEANAENKQLHPEITVHILATFAEVLANAHRIGLRYNDAKLEHLFWDADTRKVTIIDWGNARPLESGKERLDLQQFAEMLRELLPNTSELRENLVTIGKEIEDGHYQSAAELAQALRQIAEVCKRKTDQEVSSLRQLVAQAQRRSQFEDALHQLNAYRQRFLVPPSTLDSLQRQVAAGLRKLDRQENWVKARSKLRAGAWDEAQQLLYSFQAATEREDEKRRATELIELAKLAHTSEEVSISWNSIVDYLVGKAGDDIDTFVPDYASAYQSLPHTTYQTEAISGLRITFARQANLYPIYWAAPILHLTLLNRYIKESEYRKQLGFLDDVIQRKETLVKDDYSSIAAWQKWYKDIATEMSKTARLDGIENTYVEQLNWIMTGAGLLAKKLDTVSIFLRGEDTVGATNLLSEIANLDPDNPALPKFYAFYRDLKQHFSILEETIVTNEQFTAWLEKYKQLRNRIPAGPNDRQLIYNLAKEWQSHNEDIKHDERLAYYARLHTLAQKLTYGASACDFLQKERMRYDQMAPWESELEADSDGRDTIASALASWTRGEWQTARDKLTSTLSLQWRNKSFKRWWGWIDNLLLATEQLDAAAPRQAWDLLNQADKIYSSDHVLFLKHWCRSLNAIQQGEFHSAKQYIIKATETAYGPGYQAALNHLDSLISILYHLYDKKDFSSAKRTLSLHSGIFTDTVLIDVIEYANSAQGAWQQGNWSDAVNNFDKAIVAANQAQPEAIYSSTLRKVADVLQQYHETAKGINNTWTDIKQLPHDSTKVWQDLSRLADDIEKMTNALNLSQPKPFAWHQRLATAYKTSPQQFVQAYHREQDEYRDHVFTPLYHRWVNDLSSSLPSSLPTQNPTSTIQRPSIIPSSPTRRADTMVRLNQRINRTKRLRYILFIIFIVIVAGSLYWALRVGRQGDEVPTPTQTSTRNATAVQPTPTQTAITPVATSEQPPVVEVCQQLEDEQAANAWTRAYDLLTAAATDPVQRDALIACSNLSTNALVIAAAHTQALYMEGEYENASLVLDEIHATLEMLGLPITDHYDLDLFHACATYRYKGETAPAEAWDVLQALETQWSDKPLNKDVSDRCGFELQDALTSLRPEPDLTPDPSLMEMWEQLSLIPVSLFNPNHEDLTIDGIEECPYTLADGAPQRGFQSRTCSFSPLWINVVPTTTNLFVVGIELVLFEDNPQLNNGDQFGIIIETDTEISHRLTVLQTPAGYTVLSEGDKSERLELRAGLQSLQRLAIALVNDQVWVTLVVDGEVAAWPMVSAGNLQQVGLLIENEQPIFLEDINVLLQER